MDRYCEFIVRVIFQQHGVGNNLKKGLVMIRILVQTKIKENHHCLMVNYPGWWFGTVVFSTYWECHHAN